MVSPGRRIRVTGFAPQTDNNTGATWGALRIYEDATMIQNALIEWVANTSEYEISATVVRVPTPGVHVYKLTLHPRIVGAGTARIVASSTGPTYIHVEDVGV